MGHSTTLHDLLLTFGQMVRAQRRKLGISQEELAERSGLHRTYITDVERGVRNLTFDSAQKLTTALNLPLLGPLAPPRHEGSGAAPAPRVRSFNSESAEILLVDDDPKDLQLTIDALHRYSLINHIVTASSGAEALRRLGVNERSADGPPVRLPHVVLLDLRLPDIDGTEVLRRIREHEPTRAIPLIIMTASRSDVDYRMCIRLGVKGYLTKPVDWVEFSLMMPKFGFQWMLMGEA